MRIDFYSVYVEQRFYVNGFFFNNNKGINKMETTSRATLNQYAIDNTLSSYLKGDLRIMEFDEKLREISQSVDNDIQKLNTDIIQSKYPKSNSYDNALKLVGEAQRTRAYTLLGQDISVIRNEMQRGINENNFDFVFTLAEGVYNNDKYSRIEQLSLDKIFNEALKQRGIYDKAKEKNKLQFVKKELDTVLSMVGKKDPTQLVHDAQFERSRYGIIQARNEDEQPKKIIAELIKEL